MADPLSALAAIGAVSSVLQIVDFSGKVLYHAAKLTASEDALEENVEIESLTREHEKLTQSILTSKAWSQEPLAQISPLLLRAQDINKKAGELLQLLSELKVSQARRGVKRALYSAKQAARAISKRSQIDRKQTELQSLTSQLSIIILQHIAETQTELHGDLKSHTRELIQTTFQDLYQAATGRTEAKEAQRRIVKSLHFADLESRHDAIPTAHQDTYSWALNDPDSKLRAWLAEESGLFWIVGKPGSGKSTFMKSLVHNPETASLLGSWTSQGQKCMVADFFFWYLGTAKQKSVQGLLQGILYKILSECPELVAFACPERSNGTRRPEQPWSEKELFDAARAIAETDCRSHFNRGEGQQEFEVRLLFFIDGLDEFDGNHGELVSVLQQLAAGGRIKICVSCRPWNVFINAIRDTPFVIHLQDLTRGDIEHYVRDSLTKAEGSQRNRSPLFRRRAPQAEKLIRAVVKKANGVFFWVFLVVRSLISGFEEGDSISIMQARVDQLPGDLIPFFRVILERMDKVYQRVTATALVLAGLPQRPDCSHFDYLSFLDLWPLVDDMDHFASPDFAFAQEATSYSVGDLRQMAEETARLIRSSCRDFLHMPRFQEWKPEKPMDLEFLRHDAKVEFIHRTVYDYLSLKDVRDVLRELCPDHLQDRSTASKLALARAKMIPLSSSNQTCGHLNDMAGWISSDSDPDIYIGHNSLENNLIVVI